MILAIGEITIANIDDVNISTDQPADPVPDQLWLDTSTVPNVLKRWGWIEDEERWDWLNASPTSPEDIGAETPEGSQEKADEVRTEISKYLDFDPETGLQIGGVGSPSKTLFDHQSFQILYSGEGGGEGDFEPHRDAVAWIYGKKMYIDNVQTTKSLIVGVHEIKRHEDSDVTLIRYVGPGGGG